MKKYPIIIMLAALISVLSGKAISAQETDSKTEKIEIKTSAICGMCKERLEKNIAFEKGVKSVELDEKTKVLTITYKKGKNSKENLKKAVTKLGYDADEMPADKKAHDRLPSCCQKGNESH
jgi:mercuric ion binding protein